MEKDFDCKPHPKHQLLDHEKLEKTVAMYPLKMYDIILAVHLFLERFHEDFAL